MAKRRSYYDALKEPADGSFCANWRREQLIAGIEEITENMKGSMSNADRIAAHQDRKAMRERLAKLTN